jgi:hypothetical protein
MSTDMISYASQDVCYLPQMYNDMYSQLPIQYQTQVRAESEARLGEFRDSANGDLEYRRALEERFGEMDRRRRAPASSSELRTMPQLTDLISTLQALSTAALVSVNVEYVTVPPEVLARANVNGTRCDTASLAVVMFERRCVHACTCWCVRA